MDRWKNGIGKEFVDHLLKWGRSGNGLVISESPFGKTNEGLLDLRGLNFDLRMELLRVEFKPADFGKARFKGARIELCTFTDSLWEGVDLTDFVESGSTYFGCHFAKCSFQAALIGYRGSRFVQCTFVQCDFKSASFIRPEFDDCVFDSDKLYGCDFFGSSFERCKFSGTMEDVWFRGGFPLPEFETKFGHPRPNRMLQVSFEEANLLETTYSDQCDLSTVKIPNTGKYALLNNWPHRLLELKKQAESWPTKEQKMAYLLVDIYIDHAANQHWFLLNIEDLRCYCKTDNVDLIWRTLTQQ
ncbi:MAG: pentapeptide repeat-containing protein [Flavobacteriales bacterium]|nr:pentapeptide repeat-containing protein [Flavobacteriales bacterium]